MERRERSRIFTTVIVSVIVAIIASIATVSLMANDTLLGPPRTNAKAPIDYSPVDEQAFRANRFIHDVSTNMSYVDIEMWKENTWAVVCMEKRAGDICDVRYMEIRIKAIDVPEKKVTLESNAFLVKSPKSLDSINVQNKEYWIGYLY